jgi:hypothetical protein
MEDLLYYSSNPKNKFSKNNEHMIFVTYELEMRSQLSGKLGGRNHREGNILNFPNQKNN